MTGADASSASGSAAWARARDLGASGYVGKPIDRERLVAVLAGLGGEGTG